MKPGIPATFLLISMSVLQFSSLRMPNEPRDQHHQASAAAIAILDESHSHTEKNQPGPRQIGRSASEAVVTATAGMMMI